MAKQRTAIATGIELGGAGVDTPATQVHVSYSVADSVDTELRKHGSFSLAVTGATTLADLAAAMVAEVNSREGIT